MSGGAAPERPEATTTQEPLRPLLVTHSGSFHLDDAFAYAVLRLALGVGAAGGDHALVRTRAATVIAGADIAWDVGAVYDAAAGRFDHHQRAAPLREDGLPYGAAGLAWRHQGEEAVRTLAKPPGPPTSPRRSVPRATVRWCAGSTESTTGSAGRATRPAPGRHPARRNGLDRHPPLPLDAPPPRGGIHHRRFAAPHFSPLHSIAARRQPRPAERGRAHGTGSGR